MKTYTLRDPKTVERQKPAARRPQPNPAAPAPAVVIATDLAVGDRLVPPVLFIGLDVHKDSIAVSLAPSDSTEVRRYGVLGGTHDDVLQLAKKLQAAHPGTALRFAYEAGPTGFPLQRCLRAHGHGCIVIAPSKIPRKPGDRIKTDRRDADQLARLYRAGELTAIHVPDPQDEAVRDLLRARYQVVRQQHRARQQLKMFLLRQNIRYAGTTSWTPKHLRYLATVKLPFAEQQFLFQEMVNVISEAGARTLTPGGSGARCAAPTNARRADGPVRTRAGRGAENARRRAGERVPQEGTGRAPGANGGRRGSERLGEADAKARRRRSDGKAKGKRRKDGLTNLGRAGSTPDGKDAPRENTPLPIEHPRRAPVLSNPSVIRPLCAHRKGLLRWAKRIMPRMMSGIVSHESARPTRVSVAQGKPAPCATNAAPETMKHNAQTP